MPQLYVSDYPLHCFHDSEFYSHPNEKLLIFDHMKVSYNFLYSFPVV